MLTDRELRALTERHVKGTLSRDDERTLLVELHTMRDVVRSLSPGLLPAEEPRQPADLPSPANA